MAAPPPPLAPVLDSLFLLSLWENVREGIGAGGRRVSLLSLGPNGPYSSTSHTRPKALKPSRPLSVYTNGANTRLCLQLISRVRILAA